jgi:aldose 1-epimerase
MTATTPQPATPASGDGATPVPPSGDQHELRHGDHIVTVVEVGGGVRDYRVGDVGVLDGYAVDEMCTGARGQTLVPWPNRIAGGAYTFDGESYQLSLTEPEKHNAIHGLLRWHRWSCDHRTDASVVLSCRLHPQPGYPFTLDVRNEYTLDGGGLTVRTSATNVGDRRCPYALGFHPYLSAGLDRIDPAVVRIPAATYLPTDDRGIPVGRSAVAGTEYDFRAARPVGDTQVDNTYTDLERDADGLAAVSLEAGDGRTVALWLDRSFDYVEIFTGDTLPEPHKRRTGLGVEPMTAPPDAFATGTGLLVLEPGDTATTSWGIRVTGF